MKKTMRKAGLCAWRAVAAAAAAGRPACQALASEAKAEPPPSPTALEQFFPFIILGLLFYFLLIRPQQRKLKQHGDFLSKIKRGDEVLTSSGIFGRIEGLTDQFAVLEVADNVRIRILKSQISSFARQKEEEGGGSQKKSSAKKTLPQKAGARRAGQARRGKKRRPANV